jgi:hypothetical protein
MGKIVFSNAYFAIDSTAATQVDLSDHVKSLTLNFSNAEVDATCMTAEGLQRLKGLQDWSMDVEFAQDFAAAKVNATIVKKMNSTAPQATVSFRPTTAAAGAANPEYRGEGIVFEYTPASGSVGDLAVASISIRAAADYSTSYSLGRVVA